MKFKGACWFHLVGLSNWPSAWLSVERIVSCQICAFQEFSLELVERMGWNLTCWPYSELIRFWSSSVDFPHFCHVLCGSIRHKFNFLVQSKLGNFKLPNVHSQSFWWFNNHITLYDWDISITLLTKRVTSHYPKSVIMHMHHMSLHLLKWVHSLKPEPKASILQTIISNAFSWNKINVIRFKYHWSLFWRKPLTTSHH